MAAAKKPAAKSTTAPAAKSAAMPPYGVPIKEAIASGDVRKMKAMAAQARKHIASVESALKTLDARIAKLGS